MPDSRLAKSLEELVFVLPSLHARFHEIDCTAATHVGLSEAQRQLLESLDLHGGVNNGRLCLLLGRAQSSVSELVERLVGRGLVTRDREVDRRKSIYRITAAGQEALSIFRSVQGRALAERLSCLSPEARQSVARSMGVLLEAFGVSDGTTSGEVAIRVALN